ncbi:MAG TPA: DMT family transporter [Trebonia sp.]|nr:DMT family transporter [Trebonia sp.]
MTYLFAVLAACANATSSVLQRKADRQVPMGQNLSLRLIRSLLHEPVWFGGVLAVIVGFLLQAAALGHGELAVVEPILVVELPITLLIATRVFHTRLCAREWGASATMAAGLAGLLYGLSPTGGAAQGIRWYSWVVGIAINLAVIIGLVAWGRRGPAGRGPQSRQSSSLQAAILSVATGAGFGMTAALIKAVTMAFSRGLVALVTGWELYAMIATGIGAMFILQSALNAGPLVAAQPGLTLTDPIVSILWGVLVFHERVRGGWFLALTVVGGLVMVGAVLVLARSPMMAQASEEVAASKRVTAP